MAKRCVRGGGRGAGAGALARRGLHSADGCSWASGRARAVLGRAETAAQLIVEQDTNRYDTML